MGASTTTPNSSEDIRAAAVKRQGAVAGVVDASSDAAKSDGDSLLVVHAPEDGVVGDEAPKGRRSSRPSTTTAAD